MKNLLFDADFIHPVGEGSHWQESVVLILMERDTGLTAYFRIGTQPNAKICQEWIYLQAPDGVRFRRLRFNLPMTERSRRSQGMGAGGLDWTYQDDGSILLTGNYPDVKVELRYRDFYPSTPCWKWLGTKEVDIGAAAHYESSGSVTGEVTICGKTYEIKRAMGHRDHSWGTRDGNNLRACRWIVGTTGPELSHSVLTFFDRHGNAALGGWVVRNGVVHHAKEIDVVVFSNTDGVTVRGGKMALVLETDERVDVDIHVASGFITGHDSDHGGPNSYVCSENVSRTRIGNRDGICCFTVCNNVTGVGEPVMTVLEEFSTLTDGISQRASAKSLIRL
jgi:hypothetical protein